jgi:protein SCO1/2
VRDRQWLARYIARPGEMVESGDPVATALVSKYRELRMPNLELGEQQVDEVIAFLESIGPRASHPR